MAGMSQFKACSTDFVERQRFGLESELSGTFFRVIPVYSLLCWAV